MAMASVEGEVYLLENDGFAPNRDFLVTLLIGKLEEYGLKIGIFHFQNLIRITRCWAVSYENSRTITCRF